ncbi:hypothetical protein EVAR_54961_1 [Eumeta japonica]|uniref:Uncharacterized protein n=1 Tax=Eumeta variegata TaxID=151549 RepID=A0A4C1YN15_EUMVA|nr:hypothetical protein EVAR_54961_1 [Eumeta japonica]
MGEKKEGLALNQQATADSECCTMPVLREDAPGEGREHALQTDLHINYPLKYLAVFGGYIPFQTTGGGRNAVANHRHGKRCHANNPVYPAPIDISRLYIYPSKVWRSVATASVATPIIRLTLRL